MLDSGCGSGEHTLLAASLRLPALGVDVAETALAMALAKWRVVLEPPRTAAPLLVAW